MQTKLLPIYLPKDDYRRLEEMARAEIREPTQQAHYLLRQALAIAEPAPRALAPIGGGPDATA